MTAKEYLGRIRRQRYKLQQVKRELLEVQADILTLKAASLTERVSGSKISDIADKYIKLERYLDRVNDEWDVLIDMRIAAKNRIDMLPEATYQDILYARYINNMDWDDIAEEQHYNPKYIFRVHGRALQSFTAIHKDFLQKVTQCDL
ncbi:hypothetical protein [Megasphaera massiliensis]|uniref:hypothetical protein n=1 Tax=Megasphaera massiliensis TaxID=1232428 RepID=UPI0005C9A0F9|nr:hypothetical protein [Megasphaera massiliensis]